MVQAADGSHVLHSALAAMTDGRLAVPAAGPPPYSVVVKARGYAYKTLHGLTAGGPIAGLVGLAPAGRSFVVEVAEGLAPCALELRDQRGQPVGLSTFVPIGAVLFGASKALFNEIEPGTYVAVLTTCDGQRLSEAVHLAAGNVPTVRFGSR